MDAAANDSVVVAGIFHQSDLAYIQSYDNCACSASGRCILAAGRRNMEPSDDLPDLRHIDKYVRLLVRTYIRRENIYILESLIYRIKIQKMISITSKEMCCGCAACEQRCPKSCIVMHEDEEGFLYPQTDMSKCIDCGLCEKVCPVLNQGEKRKPLYVYAAKNKNP